ncbi:hypothetical protein PVL29_011692 [Vitis rotundifolia]|uniref:FHA domain-containing protein n=1 Tax=Vitis rotundifolia TaxID=103349 RepID=A0AA38ZQ45_VITRO|nr:hypothetical protein PVL29_011692 [Vitis rotundifolia]
MEGSFQKLIIEKGPKGGETLEYQLGSAIRIGRVVNNLPIKDSDISSKHFSFQFEYGKWVFPPDSLAHLRDLDSIKIGESTSITIRIIGRDENRLHQNPRRGGELDAVGSVAENWGRKGVSKTVRVLKEEENGIDLATVSEVGLGKVLDNDMGVMTENRGRRGRPKKAKVLKNEAVEEFAEVQKRERSLDFGRELEKVGQIGVDPSKKAYNLVSSLMLQKIPEISKLDCLEIGIEEKKTREGLRRKRNTLPMETLAIDDLTGKEVKVSNCGEKTCTESINISGAKERFAEVGDGPDLEKMTLGDWFDFVELHLPKQIYDVIEEMVAGMRESGERVREHMLQQKNEKGKLAIC